MIYVLFIISILISCVLSFFILQVDKKNEKKRLAKRMDALHISMVNGTYEYPADRRARKFPQSPRRRQ